MTEKIPTKNINLETKTKAKEQDWELERQSAAADEETPWLNQGVNCLQVESLVFQISSVVLSD